MFAIIIFSAGCNPDYQIVPADKQNIQINGNSRITTFQDFKDEANGELNNNEINIISLKAKMQGGNEEANATFRTTITGLEKRNNDLKYKIDNYQDTLITSTILFQKKFTSEIDSLDRDFKILQQ